jgi:hypothetical protein
MVFTSQPVKAALPGLLTARRIYERLVSHDHTFTESDVVLYDAGGTTVPSFELPQAESTVGVNDFSSVGYSNAAELIADVGPDGAISNPGPTTLTIDQFKLWATPVAAGVSDDVALGLLADQLASDSESFLAGIFDASTPAGNKIGSLVTPKVPTKADAYEYLCDVRTVLDLAGTPVEDRWCVIPPWFLALVLKDTRFTNNQFMAPYTGARNLIISNGLAARHVGWAAGMALFVSLDVPNATGAKYRILASVPAAVQYAETFGDIGTLADGTFHGVHIYGAAVPTTSWIASLIVSPS